MFLIWELLTREEKPGYCTFKYMFRIKDVCVLCQTGKGGKCHFEVLKLKGSG